MDEELEQDTISEDEDMSSEDDDKIQGEDNIQEKDDIQARANNEIVEPKLGMVFNDADTLYDFWIAYGTAKGFPVRKRSSYKRENGTKHFVVYMCSLGGKSKSRSKNPNRLQAHTRLGCPVKLDGRLGLDGKWRITVLHLEHNHVLSPSKAPYFNCNRNIPRPVRRRLELNDRSGIRVNKNVVACIDEYGGYENATFTPKDLRNEVTKSRRLRLGEGDAVAIRKYFKDMQKTNPGFFFSMDLNEKGRLQNVFWADTRSIEAYKEFGRAVTFDTTYLVNKYDMPFAPFVGVNHHGQSVLLGCGLISAEDIPTFCWLFRTWLECMDNVAPEGIITDQDKAMQAAIEIVFPTTRHRWCLWHITKKFGVKLGSYTEGGSIISHVSRLVYDSQKPLEFEENWKDMLDTYNLHEDEWLSGLYDDRHRWIPCFVKSSYWAGMSTTQRSEGINAFFDEYVHSKTTLKQFVEQYGNALRNKVQKKTEADYRSITQMIPCATHFDVEKQFQSVYTLSKFKEFQDQLLGKVYCAFVSKKECVLGLEWVIQEDMMIGDGISKRANFTVLMNESQGECDIKCSCQLFEFRGIFCKHALVVFHSNYGNVKLPEKYIFKTWRKDVKRCHSRVKITYDGWVGTDEQKRYEQLCTLFTKVAIVGSEDEIKSKEVVEFLDCLHDHLSNIPAPCVQHNSVQHASSNDQHTSLNDESEVILDPICKRQKGRPPKNRRISAFDKIMNKKREAAALKASKICETSISKDDKTKQNRRGQTRKKVQKEHQSNAPSQGHELTTRKSMPMRTQNSSQESVALGVHPTDPRLHIPQAYMGEHGFPYGVNMNLPYFSNVPIGYVPNVPIGYVPNVPTGYVPNACVQPTGYGPSAYVQHSGCDPNVVASNIMQEHTPATWSNNNNTRRSNK